jgi:glycosyltransferase involved in cell wall biosynthesis
LINVSVIIPNFNHAAYLKERIDSVLAQTYTDYEVIILDDASTDNSKDIIELYRQHPKVSAIIYNEVNSGSPFKQWAKGIIEAKGIWIWIAESDDLATSTFLEVAVVHLNKINNAGLYFCNSVVEEAGKENLTTAQINNKLLNNSIWSKDYKEEGINEINRALKYHSVINNVSAVVFKKSLLSDNLLQLKKFMYYGDWFAYIHILTNSNIIYNKDPLNKFRRTTASHSQLMTARQRINIKEDCFRILLSLQKTAGVTDKKELIKWFNKLYTGFGIKTDSISLMFRTVLKYYSINFGLANRVIFNLLKQKIFSKNK